MFREEKDEIGGRVFAILIPREIAAGGIRESRLSRREGQEGTRNVGAEGTTRC